MSLIKEYESEEKEVKDLEWVKAKLKKDHKDGEVAKSQIKDGEKIDGIDLNSYWRGRQTANYIARCYLEDLDEPETLSQEFIDEYKVDYGNWMPAVPIVHLQNLLVPKQEEVDQAYKDGYETGKQHATKKQSEETETVARVLVDYLIASAKLKLALKMEVEELKEC